MGFNRRKLEDQHREAALVRLSRTSIADEMREEHCRRALGE